MIQISNIQYFNLEKFGSQFILKFTKLSLVPLIFSNNVWRQCFAPNQRTKQAAASASVTTDSYLQKRGKSFLWQSSFATQPHIDWGLCLPDAITCQLTVVTCTSCNWKRSIWESYFYLFSSFIPLFLFLHLNEKFNLMVKTPVGKVTG